MKRIISALLITSALPAFAEGDYFDKKYEVQMSPNLGFSSYSGFHLGFDAAFLAPLSERWQWKTGGGFVTRTRSNYKTYSLTTGAQYNFSGDWSHAFFLGGGVGYGNRGPAAYRTAGYDDRSFYGYAEFGKRLTLNKSGTVTWAPNVVLEADKHGGVVSINPLNFGYSF